MYHTWDEVIKSAYINPWQGHRTCWRKNNHIVLLAAFYSQWNKREHWVKQISVTLSQFINFFAAIGNKPRSSAWEQWLPQDVVDHRNLKIKAITWWRKVPMGTSLLKRQLYILVSLSVFLKPWYLNTSITSFSSKFMVDMWGTLKLESGTFCYLD